MPAFLEPDKHTAIGYRTDIGTGVHVTAIGGITTISVITTIDYE